MAADIKPKTALITGVTGQDGSYLASFLCAKNYIVHGVALYGASAPDDDDYRDLQAHENFRIHHADLTDSGALWRLLAALAPDEIYNFGAQSHVKVSFDVPEATAAINGLGTLRLLEAVRGLGLAQHVRFYQAGSSEMFGNAPAPQNEDTPFAPCSPYGTSKLFAYWTVRNYRDSYGLHASNGILFNHESPRRGDDFVTRKITRAVAALCYGGRDAPLLLGNLDAKRDWGYAPDYIEGIWMMLQREQPGDYVLATGKTRSVRDFVTAAFAAAGRHIIWRGSGVDEIALDPASGAVLVRVDPSLFRPCEIHELCGDASRAQTDLGWRPKTSFAEMVAIMLRHDAQHFLCDSVIMTVDAGGGMYDAAE